MKKSSFITPVLFVVMHLLSISVANAQSKTDPRTSEQTQKSRACHCYGELPCWGFIGAVGSNFTGLPCRSDAHDAQCCERVSQEYRNLSTSQKQVIANCLCAQGKPNGYSYSVNKAMATDPYSSCPPVATLVNTPPVLKITCKCPSGWLANQTNQDGGITADGKCKKAVCGPISVPTPSGYTAVSDWGFIGGNTLYAWGSAANGGAAKCDTVILRPAVCKLQ